MMWALCSDPISPIEPEDLADLYLDTCPRNWSVDDAGWPFHPDSLPFTRFYLSADAHPSIETQVDDALDDYIVH